MIAYFVARAIRNKIIVGVVAISGEARFFRRIMSAELMAMRVSQVPSLDLPSKSLMCTNALNSVSCTASSASS